MDFRDFLANQEEVYSIFRDTSLVEKEGIVPNIPDKQGGYLVAYCHSNRINEEVAKFSEQVNRIAPAITYKGENIHTALSVQVQDNFSPEDSVLTKLCNIIYDNTPASEEIVIEYMAWLMNQNTGICAGVPNESFFKTSKRIVDDANQQGIQFRLPQSAHITANSFLLRNTPSEQTRELLNFFKTSKPLGQSKPESIGVGYFSFSPKGFDYNIYEIFDLKY